MRYREFGKTGWKVSTLSLGCSALMSRVGKKQSERALRAALESGINLFDTAPMYGQGQSEAILGRVTASQREQIFLCTKVGQVVPRSVRLLLPIKPLVAGVLRPFRGARKKIGGIVTAQTKSHCYDSGSITKSVEESLRRLKTDRIDILLLHSPTVAVIQAQDFREPLEKMKAQGKILQYGIACDTPDMLRAAASLPTQSIAVVELDIGTSAPPDLASLLRQLESKGIATIGRSAFQGQSSPEEALGRALALPALSTLLVGMTNPAHIEQNLRMCDEILNLQAQSA